MKTAVIYYFSGTGNTLKIAKTYASEFEKYGVRCDLYDIGEGGAPEKPPRMFDYVGIAYPIHAFNAPYVVHDFVKNLPETENKNYFILKTSGEPLSLNNVSSGRLVSRLTRKGYVLTNEYHYVMPYNMIFRHTDEMASKMFKTAKALCALDIRDILCGQKHYLDGVPFGGAISAVFRIEHPAMKLNGKFFRVSDKCTGCNACVNNCPVHNITRENGKFKFGSKCIMCTKCSFSCPVDAFHIGMLDNWRVNGKYEFENPRLGQPCKKPDFCKEAYNEYFSLAERRIAAANNTAAQKAACENETEIFETQEDLATQGAV